MTEVHSSAKKTTSTSFGVQNATTPCAKSACVCVCVCFFQFNQTTVSSCALLEVASTTILARSKSVNSLSRDLSSLPPRFPPFPCAVVFTNLGCENPPPFANQTPAHPPPASWPLLFLPCGRGGHSRVEPYHVPISVTRSSLDGPS
jgi:hypothetical protein